MRYALALTSLMLCFCTAQVEGAPRPTAFSIRKIENIISTLFVQTPGVDVDNEQVPPTSDWQYSYHTVAGEAFEIALPSHPLRVDIRQNNPDSEEDLVMSVIGSECPTLCEGEGGLYMVVAWHDKQEIDKETDPTCGEFDLRRPMFDGIATKIIDWGFYWGYLYDDFHVISSFTMYGDTTLQSINDETLTVRWQANLREDFWYILIAPARKLDSDPSIDQPFFDSFRVISDK